MVKAGQKYMFLRSSGEDDYSEEWINSLGVMAYYFAQLEGCSIWLLNRFCTAEEQAHVREHNFVQRNTVVALLLRYKGLEESLLAEWLSLLIDLSAASKMRNAIFHNPLNVDLRRFSTDGIKADDGVLAIKRDGDLILGLGDVQEFESKLVELNHRMLSLIERTTQSFGDAQ